MQRSLSSLVILSMLCMAMTLPLFAYAQESDLEATIRAALRNDPRSAGMTDAQIEAMVQALSQGAEKQGMTTQDITWRPEAAPAYAPSTRADACAALPPIFCMLSSAFGFTGGDHTIAIWLGACSLLLIFMISMFLERHHAHMAALRAAAGTHTPPIQ